MGEFDRSIRDILPRSITKLDEDKYRVKIAQLLDVVARDCQASYASGRSSIDINKIKQEGYHNGKSHMKWHINNRTGLYG